MAKVYFDPKVASGYDLEEHYLRIGDTQFFVPPTSIKIHRQMQTEMSQVLRSRGSVPKESGYFDRVIEMTVFFPDTYSINNELRPLLSQIKKCPFLPVENMYLNDIHGIEALTISNIAVQTTPGFPETMSAIIQAFVFEPSSYLYGGIEGSYDEMFNWPLFRWYYQRNLKPGNKDRMMTYFEPMSNELNDNFTFKIADEGQLESMRKWRIEKMKLIRDWKNDKRSKPGIDTEDWKLHFAAGVIPFPKHTSDEKDEKQFWKDMDKMYSKAINEGDLNYDSMPMPGLHLQEFSAGYENTITKVQLQMDQSPAHQYMGSQDVVLMARFIADSDDTVAALENLMNRTSYLTREYHKEVTSGFLQFDHQLARLFGIKNVVLQDMTVDTIPNTPGVYSISLTMYGYNRAERKLHETKALMEGDKIKKLWKTSSWEGNNLKFAIPGVGPFLWGWDRPWAKSARKAFDIIGSSGLKTTREEDKQAVYDAAVLETFKTVEMYPDLELPTYDEVSTAGFTIPDLNDGVFVDPDFFINYEYPYSFTDTLKDTMVNEFGVTMRDAAGGEAYVKGNKEPTINDKVKEQNAAGKKAHDEGKASGDKDAEKQAKNLSTDEIEAILRRKANDNKIKQKFIVGFAKYFDPKLRQFYEKGINKELGNINATATGTPVQMTNKRTYSLEDKDAFVGVMRYKPTAGNDKATRYNVHENIAAGVQAITDIYTGEAKDIISAKPATWPNLSRLYELWGQNHAKKMDKEEMQFGIASIIYFGYGKELRAFLNKKGGKLPKEIDDYGHLVLHSTEKYGEWEKSKVNAAYDKLPVTDYTPQPAYEQDEFKEAQFETGFLGDFKDEEAVKKSMLIDMLKYDKRGRLVRAFPTFFLTFVDEGQFIGAAKMSDQYFNYRAVHDIAFNNSRKNAASTLTLELSNIFNSLSDAEKSQDLSYTSWGDMLQYFWVPGAFMKEAEDRTRHRDQNFYKSIYLQTGVRVHFRMGYGSNPLNMPTMINGPITSLQNNGATLSCIVQSDGIELTRKLNTITKPDKEELGFLWGKKEPTEILDELLTDSNGFFKNIYSEWSNKEATRHSLGLMHFGAPGTPQGISDFTGFLKNAAWSVPAAMINPALGVGTLASAFALSGEKRKLSPINMNVHQTTGFVNSQQDKWYNTMADAFGIGQADEDGIAISLWDKTVWDVANVNAAIGPDMITAVHPFGFRNTLFVGKPYFPIHHDYTVDLEKEKITGTQIKSFRQMHFYDSYTSIISNQIEATEENMYTVATGTFMDDGKLRSTRNVYVDTNIWPEKQKAVNIDTTLHGKGFRLLDWTSKIPLIGGIADELNAWTGQKWFDEGVALKITAAGLRDYVKDMYDGYLTVMGDPSVKPYDHALLQDSYTDMGGVFEVKEVVQLMNHEVGFITMIKPDVVCYNTDRKISELMLFGASVLSAAGTTMILQALLRKQGFKGQTPIIHALWSSTKWGWKKMRETFNTKKFMNKMKNMFSKRKTTPQPGSTPIGSGDIEILPSQYDDNKNRNSLDLPKDTVNRWKKQGLLKEVAKWLGNASDLDIEDLFVRGSINLRGKYPKTVGKVPVKAVRAFNKSATKILFNTAKAGKLLSAGAKYGKRGAQAVIGLFLVGTGGPIGVLAFALEVAVVELISATVGEWLERWLTTRQAVIIIPLKKDGVNLLAGVNGHKGSVAGDPEDAIQWLASSPVGAFALGLLGVDGMRYDGVGDSDASNTTGGQSAGAKDGSTTAAGVLKGLHVSRSTSRNNDSLGDNSTMNLYKLDLLGMKLETEGRYDLLEKLEELLPDYSVMESIMREMAKGKEALLKGLQKLKDFFGELWDAIKDLFSLGGNDESGTSGCGSMPTIKDYNGPTNGAHGQVNLPGRLKGTDKWNDLMLKVGAKRGINPVVLKAIMGTETSGSFPTTQPNSAGAYGLMQIIKRDYNTNKYDWNKMKTDGEYCINAACDIIFTKIQEAKGRKGIYEICSRYYGGTSNSYGTQIVEIYKGFGFDPKKDTVTSNPIEGDCIPALEGVDPKNLPDPNKGASSYYIANQAAAQKQLIDACKQEDKAFGCVLKNSHLIHKEAYAFANAVAKEYKKRTGKTLMMSSGWRGDSTTWHRTGWGVDWDTPNFSYLPSGKRGFPEGQNKKDATVLADVVLSLGYDGIVFADEHIRDQMVKKHKPRSYQLSGGSPLDHANHLHMSYPNKSKLNN